jgi:hypothetical protein
MNQISEVLTTVFGVVLIGAIAFEIRRRRKHLRDLYNVLDAEDKDVVVELDQMVATGALQPFMAD